MNDRIKKMIDLKYSERDALVFVRAEGVCEYCGIDLISERLAFDCVQFDHIIPKSKGGDDTQENLAFSCQICNTAKHTFVPEGENREELIESARKHLNEKRKHANKFWLDVKGILRNET